MTYDPDHDERAFYGRRKGKALRDGQSHLMEHTLPRLRLPEGEIADLKALFPQPVEAVRLEIGFGGGEHLLMRMRESPQIGFIGVEPFINGMAKFLAVVEREGLTNIRVWDDDAALLLPRLPAGSLDAIDLLYPDPWPKRRQRKRRFVSEHTLGLFARALRAGGCFRFASDIDDYAPATRRRRSARGASPVISRLCVAHPEEAKHALGGALRESAEAFAGAVDGGLRLAEILAQRDQRRRGLPRPAERACDQQHGPAARPRGRCRG